MIFRSAKSEALLQAEIVSLKAEVKRLHDRNIQLSIRCKHVAWELMVHHGLEVKLKPEQHIRAKWVVRKARA